MKKVFQLLLKRFKSKSPKKFKYLAWGAGIIGVAALIAPMLPITIPAMIVSVLPLIETVSGIIVTTSVLTTSDEKLIQETKEIIQDKIQRK